MPIFTNIVGAFRLLTDVAVNVGGVLHELDTVYANENGVLHEIHVSLPKSLTWTCDTSKDSAAKINTVSTDGMTVTYTAKNSNWLSTETLAVFSNYIKLPAGATITVEFSNVTGSGNSKHCGIMTEKNGVLTGVEANNGSCVFNITEAGTYRLVLRAHSVTGSQSGVNYYSCTATAKITITK